MLLSLVPGAARVCVGACGCKSPIPSTCSNSIHVHQVLFDHQPHVHLPSAVWLHLRCMCRSYTTDPNSAGGTATHTRSTLSAPVPSAAFLRSSCTGCLGFRWPACPMWAEHRVYRTMSLCCNDSGDNLSTFLSHSHLTKRLVRSFCAPRANTRLRDDN